MKSGLIDGLDRAQHRREIDRRWRIAALIDDLEAHPQGVVVGPVRGLLGKIGVRVHDRDRRELLRPGDLEETPREFVGRIGPAGEHREIIGIFELLVDGEGEQAHKDALARHHHGKRGGRQVGAVARQPDASGRSIRG